MRLYVFSRTLMLAGAVAGSFACGNSTGTFATFDMPIENGIINGTPSTEKDYPATGVLLFTARRGDGSNIGSMLCSSTLIAPDVVLAAGHCDLSLFYPSLHAEYYFSLARDVENFGVNGDIELPEHTTKIAGRVPHPDFDINNVGPGLGHTNDIALLFLEKPIKGVKPADIVEASEAGKIKKGAEVVIVGYGRRHEDDRGRHDAGIKYQGTTRIAQVGKYEMQVSKGSPQPHKCHGDSGGPTYMKLGKRYAVVGVTSHSYDDEDCTHGGVDTRVDPYVDWIKQTLDEACQDGSRSACSNT